MLDLPTSTQLMANCVLLADRVDALMVEHREQPLLLARHAILQRIREKRGSLFDPLLVDAFCEASQSQAFWLSMEPIHLDRDLRRR